ncbi:uncharacterized protein cep295 isoform X5 [Gadus chalcogrammus]|uniref:uncharacterized protein cep295 isoform X5 n=1 Tax=Gadus chalcogrammus TaxID=1042646 RepID=UPI0024C4D8EA|nr:uncharacterized protein cep295 isoform X5 [Gadus chalcogrammus]
MKRKTLRRLRLSPNEESQLLREEQDRRRKIRIQQVREQARANALHIRTDVQRRREQELQLLAEELRQDWELQQSEKIQALQRLYEESLRLLGQGHRSAKENEPDWEAMAQHAEENQVKAKQRYREALKELTSQRHREQQEHNRPADARRKALQAERERAAWVASLPPPPPHPMETMEENRPPAGRPNVSGFSATHHHCPEPTVDREVAATQPDAHEEAEQEARRLLERGSEAERQREERQETARLRGRSALKREQLTQDRERLVVELEHMQQTELLRRRQQVAQMPAQIFQPLHRRREAREDGQRDMEFAFEDMYTGERRVKGDLVLQLVPEPLPAPSTTSSQDQELDVTVDDGEDTPPEVTPETEAGHRGNGQHPGPATARVEPPQPAHRQALRKLLNRIRAQRDKGWDQGRDHPQEPDLISSAAACQPPVRPDEEPERDSSIDTGSLSVEEHGREASSPLLPPEPAPVLETTGEESVLAPLPPEVLSSRMYEWKEREAALEREKRQQMALLEDLEEQKSRLEAMLRDAQRERQDMQAAVNQDVSLQEPEVPAAPPPPAASELEGSTGKDQSSRIRQHQRRLLEQNRVHQRSVAVARQRLEQYQRALRIRHSAGIMPRPPAGPPAGLAPRPPLGLSAETAVPVATPPAPVPRPTERAMPASAPGEIPVLRSDAWRTPPPPRRPDLRPAPSLTPDPTRFPRGSPEDDANGPPPARRAGLSAWLTDSIMERATGHLPESLRSPPAAPNPFTHRPLGTAESVTAGVRQSSRLAGKGDVERQRFELLEACRRTQEQREEVAQQLREQEEAQRRREAERCSHEAHQGWGEESRRKAEQERCTQEERRRREEQQRHEEQRRLEEERRRREEQQRHEEQRRLEEERRRREEQQREEEEEGEQKRHDEEQREQMRRQREALQALINTETQGPRSCPVAEPPAAGEEEEGRSRLSLLSSLLRAIEESHGGSLSHLEEQPQPAPCTPAPPASDPGPLRGGLPSQSWEAARAQRPPLTRVKLGAMVTLPGQHELSVIQEVDTPGERSLTATGPEDVFGSRTLAAEGAPGSWDRHQRPGALLTHVEQRSAVCSPLPDSELSTELSWKKRLLEQPPETEPGPSRPSWGPTEPSGSSVSPGSVGSGYTANSGSAGRPAYPDDSSSSSLSTGSYVTTGPEHDSAHTDVSEPHSGAELIRPVNPTDGFLAAVSPPSAPSSRSSCSVALSSVADSSSPGPSFSMGPQTSPGSETTPGSETSPGRAVAALFHDSSIQRIIDKYTRELNASLCSSADTTGSSIAVDENQVPPSPAQVPTATPPTETAPPRPGLEWDNAVNQILEQFSESVSLVQDISFRPLIGQQDQSSCLAADGRHSAVGRLIGQPSAQSSMIGQLPGPSMRAGANEGAWDSTLSRMIDRLSHQPCSLWSSGGRDFYSSQLMGRLGLEQSSVSFDEAQEDSRMRPLIGQLDESGVRRPGSTGGLGGSVGPTGSDPVQVLGHPPAPESPLHRPPPHQPGSDWPSSGPGRYASQLIGQPGLEETSLWLDDAPEEGGMKPLIGQLYDSAVQAAGSSGEVGSSSSSSSLGSVESVLVAPPPPPPPASQPSAPLCPPHQPSAPQPSDGQLVRRLEFDQSSLWLDDGREEGGMRHLIGRLDESGAQAAGSSGYGSSRTEQTRLNRGPRDGTGGSPQAAVDPDLSAVPEPEVPDTRRRPPLQDPSAPLQQDPECSEGFADQDSFHPLLAQVTLNESLEPSMTFHLPQQEVPSSPDGSHQSTGREEAESTGRPLTPQRSEEEDQGSLVDPSPEHPRAQEEEEGEEVPISSCLDSFCQLASSQPPSVLLESPEEGEEPMVGEGDETDGCKRLVPARDSTSQEPTNQTGSNLKSDTPIWDTIIGTAWEKGILEQSEITLVSLSDESTLGPDTTTTEDQEVDSTLLPEEEDPPATQESPPSQPGVVLEPQAGPAGGLQEAFQRKRLALIQRSALRVEEIRAKRVLAKTQPSNAKGTPPQPSQTQGTPPQPSQTQGKPPKLTQAKTQSVQNRAKTKLIHSPTGPHLGQARPEDHPRSKGQAPGQLVSSKTKEPQIKTMVVPVRTAVVPARPDGKPKHPSPVSNAGMKGCEEVRTCTPSQKKLEGLEMQLRTRRLYGRLEEVKQQREVKSKQESYAQNRLKAKEFHQKTLQKLRAKQTAQ